MEGFIGYNKENIEALRGVVERAYAQMVTAVPSIVRNGIIIPISTVWYTQEGYNYFQAFGRAVNSTSILMHDCYQAFIDDIQNAGAAWAETTGNERPVLGVIDQAPMYVAVDEIQAVDSNGSAVIDVEAARGIANGLSAVKEEILEKAREINPASDIRLGVIEGINNGHKTIAVINQTRAIDKRRLLSEEAISALHSLVKKNLLKDYEEVCAEVINCYRLTNEQYNLLRKKAIGYFKNNYISHDDD